MSRARPASIDESDGLGVPSGREIVVIADSGNSAELLVLPRGGSVERGFEFRHRGATWVITGSRRDSGILVAEPSVH